MATKTSNYASAASQQDNLERMNRRLTGDARSRIRRIAPLSSGCLALLQRTHTQSFPCFQSEKKGFNNTNEEDELIEAADAFNHLANVCLMEEVGSAGKNQAQQTKTGMSSETSTVWEREDVVVRLLVEEGKVNLLLRSLQSFRDAQLAAVGQVTDPSAGFPLIFSSLDSIMLEQAWCSVLCSGLSALEAVQTIDLRCILDVVLSGLDFVLSTFFRQGHPFQTWFAQSSPMTRTLLLSGNLGGIFAIEILSRLLQHGDNLHSGQCETLLDRIAENGTVMKVVAHAQGALPDPALLGAAKSLHALTSSMFSLGTSLPKDDETVDKADMETVLAISEKVFSLHFPMAYARFFTNLIKLEEFSARMSSFFPNGRQDKQHFCSVMGPIASWCVAMGGMDGKKTYRPLTDLLLRFK